MRKPKLERVTGVVALSYLAVIPVALYVVWTRQQILSEDHRFTRAELNLADLGGLPPLADVPLGPIAKYLSRRG